MLHGNAGCAPAWFHYAEGFQTFEPVDFYILEYPGYGSVVSKELPAPLDMPPFELLARPDDVDVAIGPRIGITKAMDHPWRYGLKGSRFVSKPFRA